MPSQSILCYLWQARRSRKQLIFYFDRKVVCSCMSSTSGVCWVLEVYHVDIFTFI